jgi:hypothetical protein
MLKADRIKAALDEIESRYADEIGIEPAQVRALLDALARDGWQPPADLVAPPVAASALGRRSSAEEALVRAGLPRELVRRAAR